MAKAGPRKINRYSQEFKATAVRLSDLPDVLIQDVADALDIPPFMLSRWRAWEGLIDFGCGQRADAAEEKR